jgi:hypothetical protein
VKFRCTAVICDGERGSSAARRGGDSVWGQRGGGGDESSPMGLSTAELEGG